MATVATSRAGLAAYQRVGTVETVSYSLGDIGFNLYWAPLTAFLMLYLTDVVGLSAVAVGGLLVCMRVSSAVAEPIFAAIADRTHTTFGRYRPYFLWLSLPLAAAGVLAFSTASFFEAGRLPAVYISFCLLNLIYTAIMVPYNAISGALTPDSGQREYLMSARFGGGFLAMVFLTWLTPKLVGFTGPGEEALGWQFAMTLFGVVAAGIFINLFLNTHERFTPQAPPNTNPLLDVGDLFTCRPWVVLFALALVQMVAFALHTGVAPYYVKYYIGDPGLVTGFIMLFGLGLAAGAAMTSTLTRWLHRRSLIAYMLGLTAASSLGLYLAPHDQIGLILFCQLLSGLALGPIWAITMAMYADVADFNAWRTGKSATAMTFALLMVARKIGATIAITLIAWALTVQGYTANTQASTELLDHIRILIGLVPAAMAALGAVIIGFYNLNPAQLVRAQAELAVGIIGNDDPSTRAAQKP
ncbi:MFS transporter [Asticcacaulis sp. AC402]|uniref:MFS transporter n=1 Tax=Asticcacaulis sp. AC402 TaxID=1282361 RepID=UPI0003C3FC4D|nr:glycoside-pentoside-hexuronide (GPH):cation symporter [Asticcacaulis sp. AC402]ESQ76318.1 hypothetical protein ABAC402_04265 [Asticcacaulis sp. AC402]